MLFQYKTKTLGAVTKFILIGELIEKEQPRVMLEDIDETLHAGHVKILIDLKDLKYINSSGLTVLLQMLTKVTVAHGKLAICNVNERNKELLQMTKLSKKFHVCGNELEALAFLNK
ncbi:MAG: STAS domain-containing protein [Bacteroidota bacterium]